MYDKGIQIQEEVMDNCQYINSLKEKLLEGAKEREQASDPDALMEELADAMGVIESLAEASGLSMQRLEKVRLEKKNYTKGSQQYPEVKVERQPGCLFCQIADQERKANIVGQFKHCYVIKDEYPVSNGHILIIPNHHTENWFTADEDVRFDMMKAMHFMKEQLDKEYQPHGYNIGANCGEVAGQSVMHLHLHLIPRYIGDMKNPKGGVRGVIPSKQRY